MTETTSRNELVKLTRRIIDEGPFVGGQCDDWVRLLQDNVSDPNVSSYIFLAGQGNDARRDYGSCLVVQGAAIVRARRVNQTTPYSTDANEPPGRARAAGL